MATDPDKRNTKHFTFRDESFYIVLVGNGEDITPAEVRAWVIKYKAEASRLPADVPFIIDYDWARASSPLDNPAP